MSFTDRYKISEAHDIASLDITERLGITPGSYDNGLISILDKRLSEAVLKSWRWLLGQDAIALAATATGDIFFWSQGQTSIYLLEAQLGQSTFVDKEADYFFNTFLVNSDIEEKVLKKPQFELLNARLGNLTYGDCYIAEPWKMLGGSENIDSFSTGALDVYLSLTGQTIHQIMVKNSAA